MTKDYSLGTVEHPNSTRNTDYLYRISIKGMVKNDEGEVLVVKESGRDYWDLPGGGMDHGEDFQVAIAREMHEEVLLQGEFSYRIIDADEPVYLESHDFWQVRLIFEIIPQHHSFDTGADSDEIRFVHPDTLKDSTNEYERRIYHYATMSRR